MAAGMGHVIGRCGCVRLHDAALHGSRQLWVQGGATTSENQANYGYGGPWHNLMHPDLCRKREWTEGGRLATREKSTASLGRS
jgi:hypothetical protein